MVTQTVYLHFVVGIHSANGGGRLLASRDFGLTWQAQPRYDAQLRAAGFGSAFAPGPGLGIQLQAPTKFRHRMIVCGQGKARMSSVCIASDDHGVTWVGAGGMAVSDANMTLPSEASLVEVWDGKSNASESRVLMNSRNSCHRIHPTACCWGPGCYDKAGVPHCHGPKLCDHRADHKHTRVLAISTNGGQNFGPPTWCAGLPDPDCEGSMVRDMDSGALLFANNRNGTIGGRDNMTLYRANSHSKGSCDAFQVLEQVNVGPAGYSCLASLPGGRVGLLYEHAWGPAAVARNDRDHTNLVFQLLPLASAVGQQQQPQQQQLHGQQHQSGDHHISAPPAL
eukprot:COSAG05_NODE_4252_length_1603_cov_1.121676_2_plen_337_part_01